MAATTHERPPMYQRLAIDTVLEVRTRRRRKAARRARASPSTDDIYDFSPDSASIHTTDLFDFDLKSIWSQKSYLDSDSEDDAASSSSSSSSLSPRSPASDAASSPLSAHSPASFFPRPSSPLSYLPTDPDSDTLRLEDLTQSLKPPSPFDEPAPSYDDATSAIRPPPSSSSSTTTTPWDFDPSLLASLDPHLLADPWDALATFFWDSLAPEPEPEPAPSPSPSPPTPSHSHPRPHPQPRQLWTTAARAPARSTPDFAATFDAWERLAPTDPLPGPSTGDNKPLPSLPPPSPLYALSLLSRSQASFTNPFPTHHPPSDRSAHPHILHSQFPPHPDPPSDYAHAHLATAAAIALVPRRPSEPAYLFLDPPPSSSSSSPDPDPEHAPTHAPGHARAKSAGQQVGAGGLRWLAGRFGMGMGGGGGTGKGKENVGLGQGVGSDPGAGAEGGMEEDGVRGVGW